MYMLMTPYGTSRLTSMSAVAKELEVVAGYERGCQFREWATEDRSAGDRFECTDEELAKNKGFVVRMIEPMEILTLSRISELTQVKI